MQCPFCNAPNSQSSGVCRVCAGPLRGTNLRPASPRPKVKGEAPAPVSLSVPAPLAAISPIKTVAPAAPILLARRALEKNAPRIVSVLFLTGEDDSTYPLFVGENGALQLWDVQHDALHFLPRRRRFLPPSLLTCAAHAPQCGVIATGDEAGQIHLQRLEFDSTRTQWKVRTLESIEAHRGRVLSLGMAGNRLLSAGSDGAVVLTNLPDAADGKTAASCNSQVILDGLGALSALALSPGGAWFSLGGDDGRVQMWRLAEQGTQPHFEWTIRKAHSPLKTLLFAPNGQMLMSCHSSGPFRLWAAQTGHELQLLSSNEASAAAPAFASDSRLLALPDVEKGIHLFDAWTGVLRHLLPAVLGGAQTVAFSPATETAARETLLVIAGSQEIVAWKVAL